MDFRKILSDNWDDYTVDLFPKDRMMRILDEKQVGGMSSENVRFLIHKTVYEYAMNGVYLEVGIYRGCSLLSAALYNPSTRCIGIDNFSLFNDDGMNERIFNDNLKKFDNPSNVEYYNMDYREAISFIFSKEPALNVDVYFYDGPHSYEDQLYGLQIMLPHLAERAVIIVDDINREHIEKANLDFMAENPGFASVFKVKSAGINCPDWWNGIEVMARCMG